MFYLICSTCKKEIEVSEERYYKERAFDFQPIECVGCFTKSGGDLSKVITEEEHGCID